MSAQLNLNAKQQVLLKRFKHPLLFRLFTFLKLPAARFSRVRFNGFNQEFCAVSVPYSWRSTNPFRSTYFACLAMAGEMSTGLPVLILTSGLPNSFSMLVVSLRMEFYKKATGRTTFYCYDIQKIIDSIEQASCNEDGAVIELKAEGKNKADELVSAIWVSWSIRARK